MKRVVRLAAVVVAQLLLLYSPTLAVPLTFAYEGVVDFTFGGAAFDAFLGETLRIEYTFESTTPDGDVGSTFGRYDGITSYTATAGSYIATAASGRIEVFNESFDEYSTSILGSVIIADPIGGLDFDNAPLTFRDSTAVVFGSDALPLVQPDPLAFDQVELLISFIGFGVDPDDIIFGAFAATTGITSVPLEPIPEPATLALFGLGLAGLGYIRRRQSAYRPGTQS